MSPVILSFLFVAGEYKWSSIAWGSRFDGKVHSTNTHLTVFFEYDMSDLKHISKTGSVGLQFSLITTLSVAKIILRRL